jgi:hypothetical protein
MTRDPPADPAASAPRTLTVTCFKVGDLVQLREPLASTGREPFGTVTGFVTPSFAAKTGAPDDVVVRWDSGLELAHAPVALTHAPSRCV